MRQNLTHCETKISAERADEHPKVFTDIHIHFIVQGKDLDSKKLIKQSHFQLKNIAQHQSC